MIQKKNTYKNAFIIKILALTFIFSNCTYIPTNSSNTIKGKQAKADIENAMQDMELLIYSTNPETIVPRSPLTNEFLKGMYFKQLAITFIENTVTFPAYSRLDPKKTYRKNSIEDCINKIHGYGSILAANHAAYPTAASLGQCDIREASLAQNGRYRFL